MSERLRGSRRANEPERGLRHERGRNGSAHSTATTGALFERVTSRHAISAGFQRDVFVPWHVIRPLAAPSAARQSNRWPGRLFSPGRLVLRNVRTEARPPAFPPFSENVRCNHVHMIVEAE